MAHPSPRSIKAILFILFFRKIVLTACITMQGSFLILPVWPKKRDGSDSASQPEFLDLQQMSSGESENAIITDYGFFSFLAGLSPSLVASASLRYLPCLVLPYHFEPSL